MKKEKKRRDEDEDEEEEQGKKRSVKKALKRIDDWDDTEEMSFEDVPDGKYQVRIEAARLNTSKSSGRLQVSMEFTVLTGKFKGRKLFAHYGLDTPDNRGYFRTYLARMGIEWPDKDVLEGALEELVEKLAKVSVKTRGEFQNVRIEGAIDEEDVEEEPEEEDTDEDESKSSKKKKKKEEEDEEEETDEDDSKSSKKKDEEDEEDEEEEEDEDTDEDESKECTVKFSDGDLSKKQKKLIKKVAKATDFDPDDYDSLTDLLCDIAESAKVYGTFKKAAMLIGKVRQEVEDTDEDEEDEKKK